MSNNSKIKYPTAFGGVPLRGKKSKFKNIKHLRGQSLVEAVVAVAVAVLVVTGLVALGIQSLRGAVVARNQSFASEIAQEEVERVRALRDQDWASISGLSYCNPEPCDAVDYFARWTGSSWSGLAGTEFISPFTRWFELKDNPADNKVKIVVYVTWSDPAGSHTVAVQMVLTNWR